jgi:hypothetical protein
VTQSDSADLRVYGKLLVTNSHATNVETVTVIMASDNQDDSTTVAPLTTIVLPIVVRWMMATGTGGKVSAVMMA